MDDDFKKTGGEKVLIEFLDMIQAQRVLNNMIYGADYLGYEMTEHPTEGIQLRFFSDVPKQIKDKVYGDE
jgi:hypothetical protein